MAKPQVLFIGELNKSLPEYVAFQEKFEIINYRITTVEDLVEKFAGEFKQIQGIYGAWLGFVPLGGFKDKVLEAAPESLKVISICSVGFDGYDGLAMRARNIVLTNVPATGAAEPVADLVLYNTISSFRNFQIYPRHFNLENNSTLSARSGLDNTTDFDSAHGTAAYIPTKNYSYGHRINNRPLVSPRGHNAVIVGFGTIGKTIGRKLSDLGMNIYYVKRTELSAEESSSLGYAAKYVPTILDAKEFVDLVVIACPATPETNHLVNENVISSIVKPFRIINIGRGSVIDENALVAGLKSGKVLFAGLDVYEQEPKVHPELFGREDVVLTPHIGASTEENFDFTAVSALKNIENVLLEGGKGLSTVN